MSNIKQNDEKIEKIQEVIDVNYVLAVCNIHMYMHRLSLHVLLLLLAMIVVVVMCTSEDHFDVGEPCRRSTPMLQTSLSGILPPNCHDWLHH